VEFRDVYYLLTVFTYGLVGYLNSLNWPLFFLPRYVNDKESNSVYEMYKLYKTYSRSFYIADISL